MKLGVKFYSMIIKAKKPTSVPLDAKTNKRLKTITKKLCAETGQDLYDEQIGTHIPFGGEKIDFNRKEIAEIKNFDKPSIKLMGFKPLSALKHYHNYKSSYFIYPDEEHVIGSSQLFDAMIREMIKQDKIAIVRVVPRTTSQIRFAAMIPQAESFDEEFF
jgi:ATP-dependent DNA helicase 2 subunit 1